MSQPSSVIPLDVLGDERKLLDERRAVMGLASRPETCPTGLALSGGGIRSASFNLGLLQAFVRSGLLRQFDYLSTVSGGGYVGSYLSALIHRSKAPLGRDGDDLRSGFVTAESGRQPDPIQQMIRNGRYLYRPLAFANNYVINLLLNNFALFSVMVFLCAGLAFVWRLIDTSPVPEHLYDLNQAVAGPISGWTVLLAVATVAVGAVALSIGLPGGAAGNWLGRGGVWLAGRWPGVVPPLAALLSLAFVAVAALVSAAVGATVVLGLNWLFDKPLKVVEFTRPLLPAIGCLTLWLAAATATLVERYRAGATLWAKRLLWGAFAFGLIGSAVVLATPNARTTVGDAPSPSTGSTFFITDQRYLPTLLGILVTALVPLLRPSRLLQSGVAPKNHFEHWAFRFATSALLVGIPLALIWGFARHGTFGDGGERPIEPAVPHSETRPYALHYIDLDFDRWLGFWDRVRREANRPATPGKYIWDQLPPEDREVLEDVEHERMRNIAATPEPLDRAAFDYKKWIIGRLNRTVILPPTDGGTGGTFHQHVLNSSLLPALERDLKSHPQAGRIEQLRARATAGRLRSAEGAELNRLLVEALYPADVWPTTVVRRVVVHRHDQVWRLIVTGGALACFVLACCCINLNATSAHAFYRDQLDQAFIACGTNDRIPLAGLKTTRHGGPYLIMSATLTWLPNLRQFLGSSQVRPGDRPDPLLVATERTHHFQFASGYCGSRPLGYHPTADYVGEDYPLADAVAISGAAVSPTQIDNALIVFLMYVFNLRLGQWLPYPYVQSPPPVTPKSRPLLGRVLAGWLVSRPDERSAFSMLTDGGHYENLGLWPLLQRRCKFIVVSDAACDGQYRFDELTRVLRKARFEMGVRISPATGQPDDPLPLQSLRPMPAGETPPGMLHRALAAAQYLFHRARRDGAPPARREETLYPHPSRDHFVLAKVLYPAEPERNLSEETGYLIYVKPTLTGDEPADLQFYAADHPAFPQDPTSNIFFAEECYESYRELGEHIGRRLCERIAAHDPEDESPRADADGNLWEYDAERFEFAVERWIDGFGPGKPAASSARVPVTAK